MSDFDFAGLGSVIGRTSVYLKLPHVSPRNEQEHRANAVETERWANNLPFAVADGTTMAFAEAPLVGVTEGETPTEIDTSTPEVTLPTGWGTGLGIVVARATGLETVAGGDAWYYLSVSVVTEGGGSGIVGQWFPSPPKTAGGAPGQLPMSVTAPFGLVTDAAGAARYEFHLSGRDSEGNVLTLPPSSSVSGLFLGLKLDAITPF